MQPQVVDIAYGTAVGLALGLTGGGGSIVTLPALVYGLGETVHQGIGTSLAIVAGIAAQGTIVHRKRVRIGEAFIVGALGAGGSIPGSMLSRFVDPRVLLISFATLTIIAACAMVVLRMGEHRELRVHRSRLLIVALVGISLGFLTGFLGVGGGFLIVPALVFGLRFAMKDAVATSLFVIVMNSLVALLLHARTGDVLWGTAILFIVGGSLGGYIGGSLAILLDNRRVKHIFAALVLAVGLFTGASAVGLIPIHVT